MVASGYAQQPTGSERAIIVLGAGLGGYALGSAAPPAGRRIRRLEPGPAGAAGGDRGGRAEAKLFPKGWPWRATYSKWACRRARSWWTNKAPPPGENLLLPVSCWLRGAWTRQPVAVVSNAFHCYRARGYARLVGFEEVQACPPLIGANSVLPCYLREAFAVLYYWVSRAAAGWMARFVGTL